MKETLSIKVEASTKARLKALARQRDTKPSAIIREALEKVLAGDRGVTSLYEQNKDIFDRLGPGGAEDLSTNPEHLKGFGE